MFIIVLPLQLVLYSNGYINSLQATLAIDLDKCFLCFYWICAIFICFWYL